MPKILEFTDALFSHATELHAKFQNIAQVPEAQLKYIRGTQNDSKIAQGPEMQIKYTRDTQNDWKIAQRSKVHLIYAISVQYLNIYDVLEFDLEN